MTAGYGENALAVAELAIPIPNNAAANSNHEADLARPKQLDEEARYAVLVFNPGAVNITVTLLARETLGGTSRQIQLDQFTLNAGLGTLRIVQGLFLGDGASRVRVSPVTLVGAAGAFSPAIKVRRM